MRKTLIRAVGAAAMLATGSAAAAPLKLDFTGATLGDDPLFGSASAAVTIRYDSAASPQSGTFGTKYALDFFSIALLDDIDATIATEVLSGGSAPFVEIFNGPTSDNVFFTGIFLESGIGSFSFSIFSLDNDFVNEDLSNLTTDFLDAATGATADAVPRFRIDGRSQDALFEYDRGSATLTVVPLPAALPLLLSGLAGLALLRRRG